MSCGHYNVHTPRTLTEVDLNLNLLLSQSLMYFLLQAQAALPQQRREVRL